MKKNRRMILAVLCTVLAVMVSGCGKEDDEPLVEMNPVPAVTATPTPVPVTPTPAPTATPGPRMIGTKNANAKFIYLTNSTKSDIREIYVKISGEEEWGKNLIPAEASIKAAEQVQMYYTPSEAEGEHTYSIKLLTRDGKNSEIFRISLEDMEKASIQSDEEQGILYLRYMSLSEKKEKDTKDTATQSGNSDSTDTSYSNSSSDSTGTSYNSSDNSYNNNNNYNDYGYNNNGYNQNYNDDYSDYNEQYGEFDENYDGGYDEDYGYGYDEEEDWGGNDFGYDENYAEYDENGNLIWEQTGN